VHTLPSTLRAPTRQRRGFSIAEVAIAAMLFLVVATVVSLISAKALSVRAGMAARLKVESQLDSALDEVARGSFDTLLSNTFTPPQPCPGSTSRGTLGQSCLTLGGAELRATWTSSISRDSAGASNAAADGIELRISVAYDTNSVVTRSRLIPAPNAGYNGQGVVRVRFSGATASLTSPVYLLDRSSGAVRGSATMSSGGVALIRVTNGSCTSQQPCRLALSPAGSMNTGTIQLAAANVVGAGSFVVAPAGTISQVGAELVKTGRFVFSVAAEGDLSGGVTPRAKATTQNSVCLFVRFSDGVAQREVPVCNDAQGDMTLALYRPDPADPSLTLAVPEGAVGTISVDRSNSVCGAPGQLGATPSGWQELRVCTSWTWGIPGTFDNGSTRTALSTTTLLATQTGQNVGTVLFSGANARPAAGYVGQPLWSNPREAGACASFNSCVSLGATIPETSVCPGQQCLAIRKPKLTAPLQNEGQVAGVARTGTTTTFTLTASDPGGDPVSVSVPTLPRAGVLTHVVNVAGNDVRTVVTAGTVLETTTAGGGTVRFEYDETGAAPMEWFTVRLANTLPNGTIDVDVALWREAGVFAISGSEVRAQQGTSTTIPFTALAADGTPATNQTIYLSAPTGLSVPSSATVGAGGRVEASLTVGAAAAGTYSVTATTGTGRVFTIPVIVEAAAGALTSNTPANLSQGTTSAWTLTATDRAGAAMGGVLVSVDVLSNGNPARGVYAVPKGCATGGAGTCVVDITAEATAAAGSYTLRATSGSFITERQVTVASTIATVGTLGATTLSQGSSVAARVLVTDGTGQPMPNVVVTATATATLTVASTTATTGNDGFANFTVSAAATAPSGTASLTVTAGARTGTIQLQVTGAPTALAVPASVTVIQGGTATLAVTVTDGAGNPAPNARIAGSVPGGVATIVSTRTSSAGTASVSVLATATAAAGTTTVTVQLLSETGSTIATRAVSLTVTAAPTNITLNGRGERGRTVTVPVSVSNGQGSAVSGANVVASGLPAGVTITTALTNTDGVASVSVTTGTTREGTYMIDMTATVGTTVRTIKVPFTVFSPATSATGPTSLATSKGTTTSTRITFTAADSTAADMVPVSASTNTVGLTVSATPTDGYGVAQITVTTTPSLASGTYTVTITSGTVTRSLSVVVS
jgi:hypothetical protein